MKEAKITDIKSYWQRMLQTRCAKHCCNFFLNKKCGPRARKASKPVPQLLLRTDAIPFSSLFIRPALNDNILENTESNTVTDYLTAFVPSSHGSDDKKYVATGRRITDALKEEKRSRCFVRTLLIKDFKYGSLLSIFVLKI